MNIREKIMTPNMYLSQFEKEGWYAEQIKTKGVPFADLPTYRYHANKNQIEITNIKHPDFKLVVKGDYLGKYVVFNVNNLDPNKGLVFKGVAKVPKDPVKKILWENGFTGAKRFKEFKDLANAVESFDSIIVIYKNEIYYHIENVIATKILREPDEFDNIRLAYNPYSYKWYGANDLTKDELRIILGLGK